MDVENKYIRNDVGEYGSHIPQIPAKTILSGWSDEGWFGSNYNMNLYKGCCHGCIYCDSRSECYQVMDFDTVRLKEDALVVLERDLRSKRKKGIVISGSMSDAYNPFEKKCGVMRGALGLMDKYGFGVVADTKSPLVVRDTDLLVSISRHSPAIVNMTLTTADDTLCRKIEQHVPPTSKRLEAISRLTDAGITCGVLLMPILPFINDTAGNIAALVDKAAEAGAKWLYAGSSFGVTLRTNQCDYFLEQVDAMWPGMRIKYEQTFGQVYICKSPNNAELWPAFTAACARHGLLWKMPDIVARIREGYDDGQMRLL